MAEIKLHDQRERMYRTRRQHHPAGGGAQRHSYPETVYLEGIHQYGACRICVWNRSTLLQKRICRPPAWWRPGTVWLLRPTTPRYRKPENHV